MNAKKHPFYLKLIYEKNVGGKNMPFIPVEKMKQLREAAKNGDERARKILQAQLKKEDYTSDLDAYFAPAPATTKVIQNGANPGSVTEAKATQGTGNAKLDQFLLDNGVSEGDPEYEDAINDYYNEFPEERPAEEPKSAPEQTPEQAAKMESAAQDLGKLLLNVIQECDKEMLEIMQDDSIDGNAKKGAMVSLQEIKQSMIDNMEKIAKVKKSFEEKQEPDIM